MTTANEFPQKRLDQMIAASQSFNPRDPRTDALSPKAMEILQGFNPILAFKLMTNAPITLHQDASESLWFARQLEFVRPGLFEVQYGGLDGKKFVPVETAVPAGAEHYTYSATNHVGEAIIIKSYSDDVPRSDVSGSESTQVIRGLATMYGYNMQELRAAMMAGQPLDVRKAMSARSTMERKLDTVIFYGDTAGGLKGLANQSNTTSYTVANGAKGTKLWRDKTPDEIVADMHGIVNAIVGATLGIEQPDTLLLPLKAYNIAATRRMGDGSNQTILDFFIATSPFVKDVQPTYRLDYAASGNWSGSTGRMIAYKKDPEKLAVLIPQPFEQMAPQQVNFEVKTLCHARTGGVITYFPGAMAYGDGITDASD